MEPTDAGLPRVHPWADGLRPVSRQNGMSDERTHFLEEAARCRRLAARINDPEAVTRLAKLAEEYEAKAEKEKK